jgi:hypothetical protein
MSTTLRHFAAQNRQRLIRLVEKLRGRLDDEASRMRLPGQQDALVDLGGCGRRLGSERILAIVSMLERWGS